jgi:hypothetical protein
MIGGCTQNNVANSSNLTGEMNVSLNQTISDNIVTSIRWSRYTDPDNRFIIDVPSNFTVDKYRDGLRLRSQPRKIQKIENITWLADSPFNDVDLNRMDWSSLGNYTFKISDIVILISSDDIRFVNDPILEASWYENWANNNPKSNTKYTINDIFITGIPAKEIITEIPNNPYWVKNLVMKNGMRYTISYGEYETSQYNQRNNLLPKIINSFKFIDPQTYIPEQNITYITVSPTMNPVAHFEQVFNQTIVLNEGDVKIYSNSYDKVVIIKIQSDSPLTMSRQVGEGTTTISNNLTDYKGFFGTNDIILANNHKNPAKVAVQLETVECQGDPPLYCYGNINLS